MKYLQENMKREYTRLCKEIPDIADLKHPLINVSDVLKAYFILADYFTDESSGTEVESMLVGVRSADLLNSALSRQVVSFEGRQKYTEPLDICSTLFYGLDKDHAFSDGNKRTALLILLYQLILYGYMPSNSVHEYEKLVLAVASNRLNVDYSNVWKKFRKEEDAEIKTISYCLRRMTKRKDGSYHVSPTMREFCTALKGADVDWNLTGGKIHFTRKERAVWLFKPKKYQHTISFGGWTRTVGAKTARDTLSALNMYDQYASYQDLFDQEEPLYALVDQFNIPLRRLKDE